MATLAASHSLNIQTPCPSSISSHLPRRPFSAHLLHGPNPKRLAFSSLPPPKPLSLLVRSSTKPSPSNLRVSSSISTPSNPPPTPPPATNAAALLTDSTRTVSSIFAAILSVSQLFLKTFQSISSKIATIPINPNLEGLAMLDSLHPTLLCSAAPLFLARSSYYRAARRATPMAVIAAGIAKWLDLYSGLLFVRILLSWFPSIPWDRQPLTAIRDLCDPYLNLFRNIIPPLFNLIDVSPILAFMVIGILSSILTGR